MKSRLAVIEDDPIIRSSIREALASSARIELEFETNSVERALLYYRTRPAPSLVLLDLGLPGISGLEGLPLLRRHLPDTNIIIHTIFDDEDKVFQAICNGASGYLLKSNSFDELESHLITTLDGYGSAISPPIARRILRYFTQVKHKNTVKEDDLLSEVEQSIVKFLVDALTYQEIADKLGMTIDGVRYYIKRIYSKLQVKSRNQLVRLYPPQKI